MCLDEGTGILEVALPGRGEITYLGEGSSCLGAEARGNYTD